MSWTDYGIKHTPIEKSREYKAISEFYGNRRAKRSNLPLMNHIDEGLRLLDRINASENAKKAFCLHPIVQSDDDLQSNYQTLSWVNSDVILLVMEYRNKANAYLCKPETDHYTRDHMPTLPLLDVKHMLIADKVQNYKDFKIHHAQTHARAKQYEIYFNNWLLYLGVFDKEYAMLTLNL
jgi:hypothetical protein